VPGVPQLDLTHRATVEDRRTRGAGHRQQRVLETSAIELKRRHRREDAGAELDARGDIAIVLEGEEVPQAKFRKVIALEQRFEIEDGPEVVRADFDR
jgi:hypothetical protein